MFRKNSGIENFQAKEEEASRFCRKLVVSRCRENSWKTLLVFQSKFLVMKIFMHRRGHHGFVENFLSHRTETKKFVKEPFCVSEIFWCRKKFMDKRGVSRFSVENFLSHSAEKLHKGTLLCFRNFLVSKLLMLERGVSRFSVVLINSKNVGKGWDSNPYLPLQKVVLPTLPWGQLQIPTNFSEIMKISDTAETRTRTYRFRTLLS